MEGARRNLEAIRGRTGLTGRRGEGLASPKTPAAELVPAGRLLAPRSAGNG